MSKKLKVSLAIDRSLSMLNLKTRVFEAANNIIRKLREENKNGLDISISILTFSTNINILNYPTDVRNFTEAALTQQWRDIHVSGNTSLWDAANKSMEIINDADNDTDFLCIILSDGEENSSQLTASALQKIIHEKERFGNWTITFQVPRNYASKLASMGISRENILEWDQTEAGVEELEIKTSAAIGLYATSLRSGVRSVKNFYQPVVVNADGIQDKDLNKLDDVSNHFNLYTVNKETEIKPFVESKTKKEYVYGSAFYELTKSEKVQKNKQLLIIKKGDSIIYGGSGVRKLLNLPYDKDAKVDVGNLSNYRIFVKSTSSNRKLVRGTGILIDPKKKKGDKPTWEDLTKA